MNATAAVRIGFEEGMVQHPGEIAAFTEWLLARGVSGPAIEIGVHRGGTAALWCCLGFAPVIAVDLPDGPWGGVASPMVKARDTHLAERYPSYVAVTGDSHDADTVARVGAILGDTTATLLFIDGDHSYEGALADWRLYRKFVRPGGVVAFHDIVDSTQHRQCGVRVASVWSEIDGDKVEFVGPTRDWGGIGVVVV